MRQHVTGTMTLLTSMIHGGDEVLGTTRPFRTRRWIGEDGKIVRIPVISGNSIRGLWRRASAAQFLSLLGFSGVTIEAFYYLFCGGALTSSGGTQSINLTEEKRMRSLIPSIAVFGGAGMGRIQPGKLYVDEGIPVCAETVNRLALMYGDGIREEATAERSYRDLMEVHGYTRRDDLKDLNLHVYLSDEARAEVEEKLLGKQKSKDAEPSGAAHQMRYENVELVAGTVLAHSWGFRLPPTELEWAALMLGIGAWHERAIVGGRSAIGHGRIEVDYGFDLAQEYDAAKAAMSEHIEENRDGIAQLLEDLK